jgi:hypothetical protein
MSFSTMPNRPHVADTSWVATVIRKRTCLHVDVRLYEDARRTLWFNVRMTKGGVELLADNWIRTGNPGDPLGLYPVTDIHMQPDARHCTEQHLRSRWSLAGDGWREAWLNELHWRKLQPLLTGELPSGFKNRSLAFHYVRAASLEPVEGMENWMRYGKGGHRGRQARGPVPEVVRRFDALDERERPLASLADIL